MVGNVVALGFQMPVNMALSLTQILVKLLTEVVEPSKDFLVGVVLDLLKDIVSRVGLKGDYSKHAAITLAYHELAKWTLTLIKDRTTAQQVCPDLQYKALKTLSDILICSL